MTFSFIPPTGNILPVKETSPVIAKFWISGLFKAKDNKALTSVQPALGPSLGVAPFYFKIMIKNYKIIIKHKKST